MFGSSNKSQESFLELFQNAAHARSSQSGLDSPKKEALKHILTSKSPLSSPVSNSENSAASALKNFLLNGNVLENSGSSEAFQASHEYRTFQFLLLIYLFRSEILVQFKKATLEGKNFPGGMLAVSGNYLAYLVNEKKVRIFNTETGRKCSIDRANGVIVGLSWSDDLGQPGETFLAVLAEDGEVSIGRILPEESEEDDSSLYFEVTSILSFPEVGRARAISWNCGGQIGGKRHLAVYGNSSSDVFFVHCSTSINGKSSFINTSIQDIRDVSLTDSGCCWVSGRDGSIEMFQFSGSSYEPSFSSKLTLKNVDAIKVIEHLDSTYCLAVSENALSIFLLDGCDCDPVKISSLELGAEINEFIYNEETRTMILFTYGHRQVQVVSLAKINLPRLIAHNLNYKSSIILDAIFNPQKCIKSGESINIGVLFYFADSICCQESSFELESEDFEYDQPIQDETESSENEVEEQINNIAPFNLSHTQNTSSSFDMDSLRTEIKLIVREAVKESLTEVIHEALNDGIRAGFNQISEDLMSLTRNLIKSIECGTGLISLSEPTANCNNESSDDSYHVRNLISQGQLGLALRKAALIGNSRLLLEVCQKFEDPFTALDEEQLSQETLTQMFGLLSLDIDEDTEVKLDWLQEILIQIDFDSGIAGNPKLSEQVDNLFDELKSLVNDSLVDGNLQKKMKTVMRLLRKFQMN